MKGILFQNAIAVRKSSISGYGVFALKRIKKGEKIEECYMLVSKGGDKKLEDYYFDAKGKYAFFTGFGSIYNHADDPNATYTMNMKKSMATLKASRSIQKGEEIFISYGDEWFKCRRMKPINLA